jgi:hypothetical protein
LDNLATENLGLKAKVTELNDEIARLMVESSEARSAQRKATWAPKREKEIYTSACNLCLMPCVVSSRALPGLIFVPNSSIVDLAVCSFL